MRNIGLLACVLAGLGACSSSTSDEASPSSARAALAAAGKNDRAPMKTPMFESMAQEMERSTGLPKPPDALPPVQPLPAQSVARPAWANDTLDATSFETLQASQNATLAKMDPEAAGIYDQAVKYLLIQVAADPSIVQTASAGGQPSDAQLMKSVKKILHGKTPSQIVLEATELAERLENEGG